MTEDYIERFLEVLNHTFISCDADGTGFVEIDKLIDCLISQEPSWANDERIREEFHKVLNGDFNYMISKEDFINSLQGWFESSLFPNKEDYKEKNDDIEDGTCSSSTSGVAEGSEITSGSSTNSIGENYRAKNFVPDEQTYTSEDFIDEMSLNDSTSSLADLRLVKALQSQISTLLRKNEYLENVNDSLLGQVSSLEDVLAKKKEETEEYKNQLTKTNNRLKIQIQKHEETEERINVFTEEKKSMTILLSQTERDNSRLKLKVSNLEKKLENSLNENTQNNKKLQETINKYNTINDLYNNSIKILEQEREQFNFKEKERAITWKKMVEENMNLHSQLDSSTSYTKDIKCQLRGALKELSIIKSGKIKNVMQTDVSSSLLSADSTIFFDEDFSLDSTIPFETSLQAELKDEVRSEKLECCCVCKQSMFFVPESLDTVDAAVSTNTIETMEKATMTTFYNPQRCSSCSNVEHKDVSVECSLKNTSNGRSLAKDKNDAVYLLQSRRSFRNWMRLLAVIILCFLLVLFSLKVTLPPNLKRSYKQMFFFTFFDLLHVQVKFLEIFTAIQ